MTPLDSKIPNVTALVANATPLLTYDEHLLALSIARNVVAQRSASQQPVYLSCDEEYLLAKCVIAFDEQSQRYPKDRPHPAIDDTMLSSDNPEHTLASSDDPHDAVTDDVVRLPMLEFAAKYPLFAEKDSVEHVARTVRPAHMQHLDHLQDVLDSDERAIELNDNMYQASWKKRGGTSAFENLCRKWDRMYARCERLGWDIFRAITEDTRREGVIDDVRDLRRYLALVECEMVQQEIVQVQTTTNGDDLK
jgi:hypothetical protein